VGVGPVGVDLERAVAGGERAREGCGRRVAAAHLGLENLDPARAVAVVDRGVGARDVGGRGERAAGELQVRERAVVIAPEPILRAQGQVDVALELPRLIQPSGLGGGDAGLLEGLGVASLVERDQALGVGGSL
jgi:hypothetical protein